MATDFDPFAGLPDDRATDNYGAWLEQLARAKDEDALFDLLGKQRPPSSKLARQQLRGRLAKLLRERFEELDVAAAPAKVADAWLREGDEAAGLQGRAFVADEVEPWARPVDGAGVLDEARDLFDAYVHADAAKLDALALWGCHTHVFDAFGVCPILDLSSPTRRCGKTTAAIVLRYLCRKALLSSNLTPASLFRAIEAWQPTLLVDEADSFAALNDELRGILNAGHTRDTAFVLRAEGDSNEPRMFSTWAPKLVAAIGRLPETIEDRSIRIVLTRKPTSVQKGDAFDPDTMRTACKPVRRRLARFTLDELDAIATAQPARPAGLHDRAWNNWRPLFAIAAAAGGDWLERATTAALVLTGGDDIEEDAGTLALQHVWEIVEPVGQAKTADVLDALIARDDSPWAKRWETKIAKGELRGPGAALARLLRPFGVRPKQLWIEQQKERGYDAEDFRTDTCAP